MTESIEDSVKAAAKGSDEAFGRLVATYYGAVFGAAFVRLKNYADAEDAAQDTFIEAWRKLPRLRDPAKFPGWLRRITIGCCGRISRRPQPVNERVESMLCCRSRKPDPAVVAETKETLGLAVQALARLSKTLREPMALSSTGYSYEEIAQMLNLPVGTVKRRLHDCRKRLARSMEDQLGQEVMREVRRSKSTLRKTLRIGEEGSRIDALLKAIRSATDDAVNAMYLTCDRIEIEDGKINGESVEPVAYAAILERVKFHAYLLDEAFQPGARSQILLTHKGARRDFDVEVTSEYGLLLKVRT
ncbi:MAG TPA: sigma-70 family RNA polymerase sigma factor [Candidatus Hydrogenedentes bacterium]|nr:sigma-70 family RNA polymerase sigma factor [Candidatus Hydrogenedentota bacterium]